MKDFIYSLGAESLSIFWLPLVVWTCFAAIVLFLLTLLPQRHAHIHADIRLALLAALPIAMVARLIPWGSGGAPMSMIVLPQFLAVGPASATNEAVVQSSTDPTFWIGMATLLVLVVSATGLFRVMFGVWRLNGILRQAEPISDEKDVRMAASAQQYLGIEAVRVLTSQEVHVPFSAGVFRPVVVLPASLSRFDVLLHEMVHHHHGDLRRSCLVEVVRGAFLFHPLIHLISRQIRLYLEISCDARVLMHPDIQKRNYAELLLHYAQTTAVYRQATLSMADSVSQLQRRINAMKKPTIPEVPAGLIKVASLTIFACSVLLVSCTDTDSMLTEADGPSLSVQNDTTYVIVEDSPRPVGGLEAIQAMVEYPALAKKAQVEGRVFVQFVVNLEGRAEDIMITRGIGAGCDEAAVEAIKKTRFTPGRQRGEPVRVKMSLPVTFQLDDDALAVSSLPPPRPPVETDGSGNGTADGPPPPPIR